MKWQFGHFLKGKRDLVGKRDQEKQGAHFKGSVKSHGHVTRATVTPCVGSREFLQGCEWRRKTKMRLCMTKEFGLYSLSSP